MAEPMISLPAPVAALVLDLADTMSGPVTTEDVVVCIQRAKALVPLLEAAFEEAGLDHEDVERLAMEPLFVPPTD